MEKVASSVYKGRDYREREDSRRSCGTDQIEQEDCVLDTEVFRQLFRGDFQGSFLNYSHLILTTDIEDGHPTTLPLTLKVKKMLV